MFITSLVLVLATAPLPVPTSATVPTLDIAFRSMQAIATLIALLVALRAYRRDGAVDAVVAVLNSPSFIERWEKLEAKAKEATETAARTAVSDKWTLMLAEKYFMVREIQESKNDGFDRRLDSLETKIDDVPSKTVMLLHARGNPSEFIR